MLKLLTLSVLVGLVLGEDGVQGTWATATAARGKCPVETEPILCPEGETKLCEDCDDDQECKGSLKCCLTPAGYKCVVPIFKNPCGEDNDCPELLKCCGGQCADICS